MKILLKDILFGILIVIVITVIEFIITMPFGEPGELSREGLAYFINRELLMTSLPAALVTFVFTGLLKTKKKSDALRRGIVWTMIIYLDYFAIGIGNNNFGEIFGTFGIYSLLGCAFVGTFTYSKVKHLE